MPWQVNPGTSGCVEQTCGNEDGLGTAFDCGYGMVPQERRGLEFSEFVRVYDINPWPYLTYCANSVSY